MTMQTRTLGAAVLALAVGMTPLAAVAQSSSSGTATKSESTVQTTAEASSDIFMAAPRQRQMLSGKLREATVETANGERIGTIQEFVVDPQGRVTAVVVGVGGFLGVGEKHVAIAYDALQRKQGQNDVPRFVVQANKQQLERAPAFAARQADAGSTSAQTGGSSDQSQTSASSQESTLDQTAATGDNSQQTGQTSGQSEQTTAEQAGDGMSGDAGSGQQTAADAAPSDGMPEEATSAAPATASFVETQRQGQLLSSELLQVAVETPSGESLGTVQNILVGDDYQAKALVLGVGGFLGLGQKQVAVNVDRFKQMRGNDGGVYLVLETTEEELQNAPAFKSLSEQKDGAS